MQLTFPRSISKRLAAIAAAVPCALAAGAAQAVTIETVRVGNPGNPGEVSGGGDLFAGSNPEAVVGGVDYVYRMGKTEVTNAQYVEFLNAKAKSDPYHLYASRMESWGAPYFGGMLRSGEEGAYEYSVVFGREDLPVNFVNWFDAIRFANWMHNGQGDGDTETGAYTLGPSNAQGVPSNWQTITRNPGAKWVLPTEDEWYKAAYHQNNGPTADYFEFPTSSNEKPVAEVPPGGSNSANYEQPLNVGPMPVGSYPDATSPYGTLDQAGNLEEWLETEIGGKPGARGSAWASSGPLDDSIFMQASNRFSIDIVLLDASSEVYYFGFRLAHVPEPNTAMLAMVGAAALAVWGMRKRWSKAAGGAVVALAVWMLAAGSAQAVTIKTVPVGNPGNPGELSGGGEWEEAIVGGVDYKFRMSKYEVTNAQYAEFLNAKAKSDPLRLYNFAMSVGTLHGPAPHPFRGGITQSGEDGAYFYEVIPGRGDLPVNWVNFYDAIRFANWMHNGQGDGDTETGAYTLGPLGVDGVPLDGNSIVRNPGAKWFVPTEDEWYKAAYHQNDGPTDHYFDYPTSSDEPPVSELPPGGSNSANYDLLLRDMTSVGSYVDSPSPYGTFDQGGNVLEWHETIMEGERGARGGTWEFPILSLELLDARVRIPLAWVADSRNESALLGFRLATVPEPNTALLALVGAAALGWWRFGRRSAGRRTS